MDKKLYIRLFRFNHKTDYLPYYKKHTVTYNENDTVNDLLNKLNSIEAFGFDGVENFGVKINNLFLDIQTFIKDIVAKTSDELVIEPVSIYRAINDLSIKNDDFFEKLALFSDYLTAEQEEEYTNKLQLDYYASNSLNFNKDYIGDHCIIIAADIIKQKPELKKEIIHILSDKNNGIWYNTAIDKRVFKINEEHKTKIQQLVSEISNTPKLDEKKQVQTIPNISQEFTDFNIAVYDKEDTCSLKDIVTSSKATFINTESKNDDLALTSLQADKNFTYKIAGKVLLDAIDNNADFIIVADSDSFKILDNKQNDISKVVGRDIDLPIVTVKQFNDMLCGEKDSTKLGFDKHKVSIPFL